MILIYNSSRRRSNTRIQQIRSLPLMTTIITILLLLFITNIQAFILKSTTTTRTRTRSSTTSNRRYAITNTNTGTSTTSNGWIVNRNTYHRTSRLLMSQTQTTSTSSNTTEISITTTTPNAISSMDKILNTINTNLYTLCHQGSDIRGTVVTSSRNNIEQLNAVATSNEKDTDWQILASMINNNSNNNEQTTTKSTQKVVSKIPVLTEFVSFCIGYSFVLQLIDKEIGNTNNNNNNEETVQHLSIAIGHDSRLHGPILANALQNGMYQAGIDYNNKNNDDNNEQVTIEIHYCSIVTTPACAAFCKLQHCHAAVMITASHLPADRNGFKFFSGYGIGRGYTKEKIRELYALSKDYVTTLVQNDKKVPFVSSNYEVPISTKSSSEKVTVHDSSHWMNQYYAQSLKDAILSKTTSGNPEIVSPLEGINIVLNTGNGAGGFFANVLEELGANNCIQNSLHVQPNGLFPCGYIPNPESTIMVDETIQQCIKVNADIGIMLDTDADRCGFVVPSSSSAVAAVAVKNDSLTYVPLNRNRLIGLLSVIFAKESPGCAIVTDSVTSEGLSKFLTCNLQLQHIRYIKGYANVINKAIEVTTSGAADVKMAIETSGHCAMQENGYLDDGTYTAVQIISLLAQNKLSCTIPDDDNTYNNDEITETSFIQCDNLLDLIKDMEELPVVVELRINTIDQSIDTMNSIFDVILAGVEHMATTIMKDVWDIDTDNLEGIRVRLKSKSDNNNNNTNDEQFFMLRKSLHDPIISLQIESIDDNNVTIRNKVIQPILNFISNHVTIHDQLNTVSLEKYL